MSKNYHEAKPETELDDVVELTDDQGNVLNFYHIGTIEYKDEWYVFFQPAEKMNGVDPDEVVIFRISGDEGNEVLLPVEDEDLLEEVYNEFMRELDEDDGEEEDPSACEACDGCRKGAEPKCNGCEGCGLGK